MTPEEKVQLINEITDATDREVDLVDLQAATGTVMQQALTTGVVLMNHNEALLVNLIGKNDSR